MNEVKDTIRYTKLLRKFFVPTNQKIFHSKFDSNMTIAYLCIAFQSLSYTYRTITFNFNNIGYSIFDDNNIKLSKYQIEQVIDGLNKLCNAKYITMTKSKNDNYIITINDELSNGDWFRVETKDLLKIKESTNKWFGNIRIYLTLLATIREKGERKYGSIPFEQIAEFTNEQYRTITRCVKLLEENKIITIYKLNEVKEYDVKDQFLSYRGRTRIHVPYMYSRTDNEKIVRNKLYENYKHCINAYFDKLDAIDYNAVEDEIEKYDNSDIVKLKVKKLINDYRTNKKCDVAQQLISININPYELKQRNPFESIGDEQYVDNIVDKWYEENKERQVCL